ncbi:hypothetical protein CF326_g7428 [Tilletia indica]|nr:hypothetical protein CF326_g7428 [Tilletia indica]
MSNINPALLPLPIALLKHSEALSPHKDPEGRMNEAIKDEEVNTSDSEESAIPPSKDTQEKTKNEVSRKEDETSDEKEPRTIPAKDTDENTKNEDTKTSDEDQLSLGSAKNIEENIKNQVTLEEARTLGEDQTSLSDEVSELGDNPHEHAAPDEEDPFLGIYDDLPDALDYGLGDFTAYFDQVPIRDLLKEATNGRDTDSSIDVRLGYANEMHEGRLAHLGPQIEALPIYIEGIYRDLKVVPTRIRVIVETTVKDVRNYLSKEFGLDVKLEHEGQKLEDSKELIELGLFKEVSIQAVYSPFTRIMTHCVNDEIPSEINAVAVTFRLHDATHSIIAPCGATLKAVWERNFTDESIRYPRFLLHGTTLDLGCLMGNIDYDLGSTILVMEEQRGGGDQERREESEEEVYKDGYSMEMFDFRPTCPPPEGVWLKIHGIPSHVEILAQPETPFGVITKHLYREFGLTLALLHNGVELGNEETPLDKRMYLVAELSAVYLLEEIAPTQELPSCIYGMVIYLKVNYTGDPAYDLPLGRIVPCGATMKAIWQRNFPVKPFPDPRFLVDCERVFMDQVIGTADFSDGVLIDVYSGMTGGGPTIGVKRGREEETEGSEEPEEEESMPSPHEDVGPAFSNPALFADLDTPSTANESTPPPRNTTIGTARTPQVQRFCGKGVRTFFKRYEAWCNSGNLSPERRLESLYFFLSDDEDNDILSFAENLEAWELGDYEGVKVELLRAFQENEADKYTVADMDSFLATSRSSSINTLEEVNKYIVAYKEIGNILKKYGRITEATYKESFLAGLPEAVVEKLERQDMEPRRQYSNPTFAQIEDDVRSVFNPKGFYAKFRHTNDQETDRKRHPERIRVPKVVPTSTKQTKKKEIDEGVKELTEQMRNMALNMNKMLEQGYVQPPPQARRFPANPNPGYANNAAVPPRAPATTAPYATPYRGDPTRQTNSQPGFAPNSTTFTACHYCNDPVHGKRQCQLFQTHLAQGIVVEGSDGRMRAPDGGLLPWRPGQMSEIAQRRYQEWKATQAATTSSNHAYYDAPEEQEEIIATVNLHEYHISNNAQATTVEANTKRKGEALEQGASKRRSPGPPEAPRTGNPQERDQDMEEVQNTEAEDGPKKRKPPSHLILSQVQEQFSVVKAVESLLKKGSITLSVEEFVGMNKEVEKELSRRFRGRKVPIIGPKVHFSNQAAADDGVDEDDLLFYTHSLPMIEVTIDGQTFKALIDTGSELDMISPKVVKLVRAAVRKDGLHKVIGIGNRPETLGGVCERLPVTIGGITNTIHAWVREGLNYDLLLGMPTITRFNMACKITKKGLSWIELKNGEGVRVKILAVKAKDPRDRRYLPPNLNRRRTQIADSDEESSTSD